MKSSKLLKNKNNAIFTLCVIITSLLNKKDFDMKKMIAMIVGAVSIATLSGCAVYPSPDQYGSVIKGSSITPDMSYHQPRTQQQSRVQPRVQSEPVYYGSDGRVYTPQQYQQTTPQYIAQPQYVQPQPQYYQQPQQQYYQSYQQPQQYYQEGRAVRQGSAGGAAIGGIVGGLAMSGVGKGNGNLAAIAAGSATGAVVGTGCRTINGGQVIGGLLGGLLGSQIGKGSGRQAAVAVGSSMGALMGNDASGGCLGY